MDSTKYSSTILGYVNPYTQVVTEGIRREDFRTLEL